MRRLVVTGGVASLNHRLERFAHSCSGGWHALRYSEGRGEVPRASTLLPFRSFNHALRSTSGRATHRYTNVQSRSNCFDPYGVVKNQVRRLIASTPTGVVKNRATETSPCHSSPLRGIYCFFIMGTGQFRDPISNGRHGNGLPSATHPVRGPTWPGPMAARGAPPSEWRNGVSPPLQRSSAGGSARRTGPRRGGTAVPWPRGRRPDAGCSPFRPGPVGHQQTAGGSARLAPCRRLAGAA